MDDWFDIFDEAFELVVQNHIWLQILGIAAVLLFLVGILVLLGWWE